MQRRKKILMLPLDERPCNYLYPKMLFEGNPDYELLMPPREKLGVKKRAARFEDIRAFLLENAKGADIAVLSIDMLLYGGLLPGRIHTHKKEELLGRLELLKEIKRANPALKIYAFHLIMRCPQYSSSEEEPDYYGSCGREIYLYGEAVCKQRLGLPDGGNADRYRAVVGPYLSDYLVRRKVNAEMNCAVVDLIGACIDFLVIPQDDSSVYGFVAEDQQAVRDHIAKRGKQEKVLIYPGADEVGMTLLARAVNEDRGDVPRISVFYSSVKAPFIVPKYEDRMLGESVKLQIAAAGCRSNRAFCEDDILLAVNAPAGRMREADEQFRLRPDGDYSVGRSVLLFAQEVADLASRGKTVAVADVAYGNGSDAELVTLLDRAGVSMRVASYSGWNTSGNSLGTAISAGVLRRIFGDLPALTDFLALRYFEDAGFCAWARRAVMDRLCESNTDYRDLGSREREVSAGVVREVDAFMREKMKRVAADYEIVSCRMPWNRMFETEMIVHAKRG